ncbi:MAG: hypothetical protein AAF216_03285 [Pseudomonadota bacterium]
MADAPEAGTRVVNQANVLYTDENGEAREALTNEVVLFVQQVFAATIEGDNSKAAASGDTARFIHTLTNTGNGEDTYCVSAENLTGDGSDFERIDVVHDADGDGLAAEGEPILYSTSQGEGTFGRLTVSAREAADLIVLGRTPAGLSAGTVLDASLLVSATEGTGTCLTGSVTDTGSNADATDGTNRDRVTMSADAILEITKASSYDVGAAADLSDDTVDYVITVTNTGATAATDITVTDTLAGSLDFASFGSHTGTFSAEPSVLSDVITAEAASLAAGDSLVIRFTADVVSTLGSAGESLEIENTASVQADLDGGGVGSPVNSNTTRDTAPSVYGVVLSDTGSAAAAATNDGGDDDATVNDTQRVDVAAPGDTVYFRLTATNTGNSDDTYNLAPSSQTGWLSDATLTYLHTDFSTPLLDTNGDGITDTGPLVPGESVDVVIAAVLPFSSASAPHGSVITATSTAEISGMTSRVSDPANLAIGASLSAGVDVANSAGATGFNDGGSVDADPDSSLTTQMTTAPGGTVTFDLFVANEGAGTDTFALSAYGDLAGTTELPAGWLARFKDAAGAPLTSTPALSAGETYAFKLEVTAPGDLIDGDAQSVFIHVESFETGATDVKQDGVLIGGDAQITLTPDQSGQISGCGVANYLHTLRNTGTTTEEIRVRISTQSHLNGELQLASAIDAGEPDGYATVDLASVGDDVAVLGAGAWRIDTLVDAGVFGPAIRLAPGEAAQFNVRVLAPCEVAPGTRDTLALVAETRDGDATATAIDTTTVSSARLELTKLGALDALCDGAPDAGFNDDQVIAGPGECVIWQISLVNQGAETVCDVRARDAAPAFTAFSGSPSIVSQPSPGAGSCTVTGSDFACTLGNALDPGGAAGVQPFCLSAGQTAEVRFGVRVN